MIEDWTAKRLDGGKRTSRIPTAKNEQRHPGEGGEAKPDHAEERDTDEDTWEGEDDIRPEDASEERQRKEVRVFARAFGIYDDSEGESGSD